MNKIEKLAKKALERAAAARAAAVKAVPEEYRDYLVFIEENQALINREPLESEYPLPPGVFAWKGKTYIRIETPYMVVAGRMKWFADDHKIAEKKYKITTNARKIEEIILNGQPIPPGYPFITVIESELLGTADGIASINIGGKGADMTHPLENAETSSLGRALAKLGYGLIGSGLASAEEVEEAKHRRNDYAIDEEANPEEGAANSDENEFKKDLEVVEVAAAKPREVPTSKGAYIAHRLTDGRFLMLPKGSPELRAGTKLHVSGVETRRKDGSILLWAKTFEEIAS